MKGENFIMLDISNEVIDYIVEETKTREELDQVIEELLAWREARKKRESEEAIQQQLTAARNKLIESSYDYYKALFAAAGKEVSNAEVRSMAEGLAGEMKEHEAMIIASMQRVQKDTPTKSKEKSDDEKLRDFLEFMAMASKNKK